MKKDENRKTKLSDIDFNLETLINSKSKSKKEEENMNLHQKKAMKIQVLMKAIIIWNM